MLRNIQRVGREIEAAWKRRRYAPKTFPAIAEEALRKHALHETLPTDLLLEKIARTPALPAQLSLHSNFGDPPVTLYSTDRFVIDAYFWLHPRTAIHNHSFLGAFTVMKGLSLHMRYDFTIRRRPGRGILLGRLKVTDAEFLHRGDVRKIHSRFDFIHQVAHLTHPARSLHGGPR